MRGRKASVLAALLVLPSLLGCSSPVPSVPIPEPDLSEMERAVRQKISAAQEAVEEDPDEAAAWGHLGKVLHAHDLFVEAMVAYRQAEALESDNVRWPYFLGAVLHDEGSDLEGAEAALRRAIQLYPEYGAARMRLAQVLVTRDQPGARQAFEEALALDPGLHPARVGLGQLLLAGDEVPEAIEQLEKVLEHQPRNGRALNTLAQAYNRIGQRDEARALAERARDAADYNLFDDPLMSEVVTQGVSSNLIWERAKADLEAGRYRQAAIGLERVVKLLPTNPGAHHQLAFAYRELGDGDRALVHLARSVELEPERTDARAQLAAMLVERGQNEAALGHLEQVRTAEPEEPETWWLIGRVLTRMGDLDRALTTFETAAATTAKAGWAAPAWALDDWGNSLAQRGRLAEAIQRFEAALATDPEHASSLFHLGLAMEAVGDREEAVRLYRRALSLAPNDLVASRLAALGEGVP